MKVPQPFSRLFQIGLKSIAQIMLQDNIWTGLLILVAVFYANIFMGLAMVLAVTTAIITAKLFKLKEENLKLGLYGFSAALVGVAFILLFENSWWNYILIIPAATLATLLQAYCIKINIKIFTLPFVLITWLAMFGISHIFPEGMNQLIVSDYSQENQLFYAIRSIGQIILQEHWISGLIFLIAIFIAQPIAGIFSFFAALLSSYLATFFIDISLVSMGLMGFNAALCAIVFSGTKFKNIILTFLSTILSLVITLLFFHFEWTVLTFPFVASCMLLIYGMKIFKVKIN